MDASGGGLGERGKDLDVGAVKTRIRTRPPCPLRGPNLSTLHDFASCCCWRRNRWRVMRA